MKKPIGMNRAIAVLACVLLVALAGCSDGDENKKLEEAASDAVVCFRVNSAGTAFENVGTGGAAYTATRNGGSFETVGGLKVFNTGGTETAEQQEIPWWQGNYWKKWDNIGYVDLNGATGDFIGGLQNFTVETYLCLPSNAQADRVGQHVWNFADKEGPNNALWFNIRDFDFMYKKDEVDTLVSTGWDTANSLRTTDKWHHVVVVKNGTKATIYFNGVEIKSGDVSNTTFEAGTFGYNHLAKPCYPEGVYDQTLFNTKFYSFAIYDKALNVNLVQQLYLDGPIGKGKLQ
jgi:hypothetical protein